MKLINNDCEKKEDTRPEDAPKSRFVIAGLMVSPEFQRGQYVARRLFTTYPDRYLEPQLRPMMDVDWEEFILKAKRHHGLATPSIWRLRRPVAVFLDGAYLGDDETLIAMISGRYLIRLDQNFQQLGEQQLIEHIQKMQGLGRQFVYLMIHTLQHDIGAMLFMLYNDLVPDTCENFMERCKRNKDGWAGCQLLRMVPNSWVQFGNNKDPAIPSQRCENYSIGHDRRGVLSMCNGGKHRKNTAQFIISLDPTPWMDYRYVAFGQLVQGNHELRFLEQTETCNQVPLKNIYINFAGVFSLCEEKSDRLTNLQPPPLLPPRNAASRLEVEDLRLARASRGLRDEVSSDTCVDRYRQGLYCAADDLRSHFPFLHLPERLLAYLRSIHHEEPEECDGEVRKPLEMIDPSPEGSQGSETSVVTPLLGMGNVSRARSFMVVSSHQNFSQSVLVSSTREIDEQ